jgi:hypothetical protein
VAVGWTSDLLTGLAVHLAAAAVGTWRPTGAYTAAETGIVIRGIPQTPDRLITLAPYPLDGGEHRGMADHDTAVQIRIRAGTDPRTCDDLADAVFELLDSLGSDGPVNLGGIPVLDMWRQSYTSLGVDTNGRWERSENFYLLAMRPTVNKTD